MLPADVDRLIAREENRQLDLWGIQDHPDGTGLHEWQRVRAARAKLQCDYKAQRGRVTWSDIFLEEAFEVDAESEPAKLIEELVQVAAVAKQWIKAIHRREITNG